MKVRNLLFAAACLCAGSAAAQTPFTMTITDVLAKPTDKAFLCYVAGNKFHCDSVAMENGTFKIQSEIPVTSVRAALYVAPGNTGFYYNPNKQVTPSTVYVEKGDIKVYLGKTLGEVKVGGTPLNDDYQAYYAAMTPFKEKEAEMEAEFQQAKKTNDTPKMEALQKAYQEMAVQKREAELKFFNSHLDSQISLDWLTHTIDMANHRAEAEKMFNSLSERLRSSSAGLRYAARLQSAPKVEIGDIATNFTSKDVNGDEVSLNDFKGKYVLVDFWASWCGPCRMENPNVVKAYNKYKDKNFEILGVSLDQQKDDWVNAIRKDGLTWKQVSDLAGWQTPVVGAYAVRAIPANFLIDPQGKIIAKNLRGEELEKKLSEVLK